jgi:hypothetical protein
MASFLAVRGGTGAQDISAAAIDPSFEGEQAVKDRIDLGGHLIGARIDPRVELVEAPVGRVEPAKESALELLEDAEGEGLVRHGEILLLSLD